jgi:pimeloyl-ACP methyl ester carboxylesterase
MPFVQAGDVRLHYRDHGRGDEPLVFVHGYTSSHHDWDETLPRLPDRYRAYAFDLRGAGTSDQPGHGYTIAQYAEDIHLATRALGLERFALIGHAMGGAIGMELAVRHPEQLRSLVLVAPAPADGFTRVNAETRARMKELRRDAERFKTMTRKLLVRQLPDAVLDQRYADNLAWQDDAYDQAWESLVSLALGDLVAAIQAPTLMVVGDRDSLRADNLYDAARIPNCALQVFYRVGHNVMFEVPGEFVALLDDFIHHGVAQRVIVSQRAKAIEEMTAG